ncbi:hypothetical protein [Flavobacterium flavipallidum]|uniref:Uncharacterized protein n=1 Tax=Flavobacterium flavipallidum TaxID=3139140 RepID=A0ABU9HJU7_9FLAO
MSETTIDITKNVLVNYKDITNWFLLIVIIVIGGINYRKDILLSKKIESFKADLTKREIKFTRHTELQIECLKALYDQIVTLHFSFTNFTNPPYNTHELLQKQIETFHFEFDKTLIFTHRNKILLTDEITNKMKVLHEKYKRINEVSRDEIILLTSILEYPDPNNTQYHYITTAGEENFIKQRIEKLRKLPDVQTFENDIKELREEIEIYFKTLVS